MAKNKKTKKIYKSKKSLKVLTLYFILLLFISISFFAITNVNFVFKNKAQEIDCLNFVSVKKAPVNNAYLNNRKVTFWFSDNGQCNYPHDAWVAIYDQWGKPLAQSGWLPKAIVKAGANASWTFEFAIDGRYSWLVRTRDSNKIMSQEDKNKFILNIDSTPPTKPPKCWTTSGIDWKHFNIAWEPSFENGLSLLKGPVVYQVDAAYDLEFKDICASSWRSGTFYELGDKCEIVIKDTGAVYVRVRARDAFGNFSPYTYCYWGKPQIIPSP
ncbi:MAG: hypothetical protein QHH09_00050 [Microgenomates group bacterium]|nr:hypothetical protein [Microgenomates group bacterium]